MRPGSNSALVLSSLVFEYACDAMILLDSELTVRALNPAAQGMLGRQNEDVAGRLTCRTLLGCRPDRARVESGRVAACTCEQVMRLHRAITRSRLCIRPYRGREMWVSASCSPLPVDHLGGAALVLRPVDDFGDALAAGELRAGELRMDVGRHRVYALGRPIHLTPIDFDLLRYLLAHAERVVSRQDLVQHVWQYHNVNERDLIKSHIAALRQRLREAGVRDVRIENVYGVGYMLTATERPAGPAGSVPQPGSAGDWW